jgi:hypothetical protein
LSFLLLLLVLPPAASCPSSCCLLSFLLKAFTKHKKRSRWSVSFALTPSRPVVALAMAEIASGVPSWEISASEPEGVNMPSNLDNVLAAKGMRRVAVPGDGNCQFAAVLTSMDLAGLEVTMTPQQLRKKAVKYLKAHRSQFSDHAWLPGDSCSVRLLLLLFFPSSWCLLSFLLLRLVLLPGVSCPSSCCLLSFLLLLPVLPPAASCASCPSSFCFLFGHLASSAGRRTWRECSSLVSTATTAPCKQLRKLPSSALRCTRAVLRSRRWRLRHPPAAASIQLLWHSCRSIIMMRWKLFLWCRPVCFLLSFLLLCLAPFCPSSCIVCPSSFSLALLSLSSQTPVAPVIAADKSEAEEEDPPLALVAAAEEDPPLALVAEAEEEDPPLALRRRICLQAISEDVKRTQAYRRSLRRHGRQVMIFGTKNCQNGAWHARRRHSFFSSFVLLLTSCPSCASCLSFLFRCHVIFLFVCCLCSPLGQGLRRRSHRRRRKGPVPTRSHAQQGLRRLPFACPAGVHGGRGALVVLPAVRDIP